MTRSAGKSSMVAVAAGAIASVGLVALMTLQRSRTAADAGEFVPRPSAFVRDVEQSEKTYDEANGAVKRTLVKGLKTRDWVLAAKGLASDFRARFPNDGSGRPVPDGRLELRDLPGRDLPETDRDGFLAVLRGWTERWAAVERTTWRPFEFLLSPDGSSAYVALHFQVAGRKSDGSRGDLSGNLKCAWVREGGEWRVRRLEWTEGTWVEAASPPWVEITDEAGLHFNDSEEIRALRKAQIDDRGIINGAGLVVGDFNGDGRPDVAANSPGLELAVFLNDGAGGFVRGASPVANPAEIGYAFLWADLDNDGAGEWVSGRVETPGDGRAILRIYRRNGDAWTPALVTFAVAPSVRDVAVLGIVPHDVDGNGLLDLFLCCYNNRDSKAERFNRIAAHDGADNWLLMNQGALRFTEESDARGIRGTQYTYVAKFFDFDFDGDTDLFEGNDFGPDILWLNDGRGRFSEAKSHLFAADSNYTMGVTIADWDNTGGWTMYISNMYSHAGNRVLPLAEGLSDEMRRLSLVLARGNQMYECDPRSRTWTETAVERRTVWADWAWSCLFFDADNDGDRDLYVANGFTTHSDPSAPDY